MLKTEHREPPNGGHSMASAGHPGREVAVFPGSPGVLAYPSYVVTYMTPLCEDPWVRVERGRVERGRVERGELGHATLYQMRSISQVNNVTCTHGSCMVTCGDDDDDDGDDATDGDDENDDAENGDDDDADEDAGDDDYDDDDDGAGDECEDDENDDDDDDDGTCTHG